MSVILSEEWTLYRSQNSVAESQSACDVLQEVLIAIHLKRGTWDTERPIGPRLSIIVRKKLIDILRRGGKRVEVPVEDVLETLAADDEPSNLDAMDAEKLIGRLMPPAG